jgi:hypothetical protein
MDIDLEKLDKLPEPGEDPKVCFGVITNEIDNAYNVSPFYQQRMAYIWLQGLHFLLGDQHIFYNSISRQYELMPTTRNNDFIPRPVTNLVQPIVTTIVSNLTKNKPNADVIANSPDEADISAASLARIVQDCKWEDDNEQEKMIEAAYWAVTCGTVFRKDYWDTSYGKVIRIPETEMQQTPFLDESGQIQMSQKEVPVYDELGSPKFNEIPLGDNSVDIIDPFRILVDPNATNEFSMSWIMETSIQKLFWIRENFDKEQEGYTGLAKDVKEELNLSILLDLRQRLKTLSARGAGSYAGTSGGYLNDLKNVAIVKELYVRPTKNWPKGQMIISAGGKILYRGDSPYYDGTPDSWHPYTIYRYETIPGRFWGKSLVEDIIEPQRKLNAIDSLIILNRKTMVSPQKLVPAGCGVPEGYWNGAPGLQIPYRPVGANGAKPEILQGASLPQSIWQERADTKAEMQYIARINEVLQGIRPVGVTSGRQFQLQLEQALGTFAPTIYRWEKFIERGQSKKLKLIAHRYREPRPEFINKMRKMNKQITDVEIMNFIGADLRDNCQVRIEAGSSLPRSNAAQQDQIMEAAQIGLLNDVLSNPIGKQKILERLGIRGFDFGSEVDVKRAQWENEMIENGSFDHVMVLPFENHAIHIESHMTRMKEPNFIQLPPEVKQGYIMHVQAHAQIQQEQAIQAAQATALAQGNLPGDMAKGVNERGNGQQAEESPPMH